MGAIALDQVDKAFGTVEVLHGIDLDIDPGELVVFVGPSGCGKSTLLRIIAGLEQVSAGQVRIDGETVNEVPASERGLAMVFQSYALYPHMSVYTNMAFGLENQRMPRTEIDRRVHAAADMLQITPYLRRRPKELSGGQRQRVAIGRAIVREPRAFLFDEPLSNLDAELRVAMRKELKALHTTIARTMIYVTHDQTEAMTLADRIVVLQAGRIEQVGRPLDLYNRPCNLFVAGFIGSPRMNLLPIEITEDGAVAGTHRIALTTPTGRATGSHGTLGIRPEHLTLVDEAQADLVATVDFAEQLGGETYLYATVEGLPQLTVHRIGQLPMQRGERLPLALDRSQTHLFDADGRALANGLAP